VTWPAGDAAAARQLAATGATARAIGEAIGRSRLAVLSYCDRNGIALKQRTRARVEKLRKSRAPVLVPATPAEPTEMVEFHLVEGCRWIEGEPGWRALTCNAPRFGLSSYCPAHHQRAYRSAQ